MPGRQILLLFLLTLSRLASAEMYTWTDEAGIPHFSDQAPIAQESEPVTLGTSSVVPMSVNLRASENVGKIRRKVTQALEEDRPARASGTRSPSAADQAECERLRQRLDKVQRQLRAGYSNDRGNRLRQQRRELGQRYSRECVLG